MTHKTEESLYLGNTEDELYENIKNIVDTLRPAAETLHRSGVRKTMRGALMYLINPYIDAHLLEHDTPFIKPDAYSDRRKKKWLISLQFWHTDRPEGAAFDQLIAESDGLVFESDGTGEYFPVSYGGDLVSGLDGAAELVDQFATECGAPSDFSTGPMVKAFNQIRPTLSRQDGVAVMRRISKCQHWSIVCYIFREDRIPESERNQEDVSERRSTLSSLRGNGDTV